MASTFTFFPCHPLVSIYNKPTKNVFKFNKTQTPISDRMFFSMKTQANSNITGIKKLYNFPEFDFKDYMESKMERVNEALDQTVPMKHPTRITEAMRYTLLGNDHGELFHAIMCLASCELVGGDEAQAMPIACALEMIFTMLLMLDDLPCMDDDDVRRGKAANHKVFGEETTILAASSLLCLAFQHVAEMKKNNVPLERVFRGIVELGWASGFDGMLGGQLMDLDFTGKEASLEEVECIHMRKTGKLVEAAAVCGAIMGGGSEEEIESLRRYGTQIGLMYQVVNDILDVTKSSEELGKTAKKDLVNDTNTYPKIMGLTRSKKYVETLTVKASNTYPKIMGLTRSKKYVETLTVKACQELSCFDETRASPLYHMIKYVADQLN